MERQEKKDVASTGRLFPSSFLSLSPFNMAAVCHIEKQNSSASFFPCYARIRIEETIERQTERIKDLPHYHSRSGLDDEGKGGRRDLCL